MRRLAHLSDVHILDSRAPTRRGRYRFATRFVAGGKRVDPAERSRRLASALAAARAGGADHVVISGDLTEVGEDAEFEHFAALLTDAGFPEGAITLVPGNHDAYTPGGWQRALAGPLARFASASASGGRGGRSTPLVDRGSFVVLPLDTTRFETLVWSGGVVTRDTALALDRLLSDPGLRDKALVLVAHHPPFYPKGLPVMRWIDGLRGCAEVLGLLARHPRLQLLHGHLHRVVDRILGGSGGELKLDPAPSAYAGDAAYAAHAPAAPRAPSITRVFGAPATCDDRENEPRVRFYDVDDGALHAVA